MEKKERDELIMDNYNLVYSIAHSFKNRCHETVDWDDLVQSGICGLIQAVDKFDPEKGYKFSTYATWWIEREIRRCLSSDVPEYINGKAGKIIHKVNEFEDSGVQATAEMIADEVELPEHVVKNALPRILGDVHLDAQVSSSGESKETFGDFLNFDEDGANDPEKIVEKRLNSEALAKAIWRIPKKVPQQRGSHKALGYRVSRAFSQLPPPTAANYSEAVSEYAQLYNEWIATQEVDEVAGEVLYGYYFENLGLKAISEKLSCSKQNVNQKQAAALKKLRMDPLILAMQI